MKSNKAKQDGRYVLGLDLGQQNDYSVLSVFNVKLSDSNRPAYELPYLTRFNLKTSYVDIVDEVISIIDRYNLSLNYTLIVDYTGVGRPVVDLFRQKHLNPVALSITGGARTNWVTRVEVNVPKKDIVTYLQLVLQTERLTIAHDLPLLRTLTQEFLSFQLKIRDNSMSVTSSYGGAYGINDDIVMSMGIAVWLVEYHSKRRLFAVGGS